MWLIKTNECLYHITIMHMLTVILKRIKISFRDVIREDTHMKEKCETKNDELIYKGQNAQVHLSKLSFLQ